MTVPLVDWILVFIIIIVAPMCIAHELIMSCIQRYLSRRTVCIGRTSLLLQTTVVERIEKEPKANPAFLAVLFAHGYVRYIRCTVLIRSVSLPC